MRLNLSHLPLTSSASMAVVAAKKKAKQPMITKLVLQGPKIYGSLLVEMAKHEVGKNLISLHFVSVKTTTQTKLQGSIVEFFRTLPRLEELKVPQHLATSAGSLRLTLLNPLSAARSGSSTLLRVLHLEGGNDVITFRRFTLSDLEKLGELDENRLSAQSNIIRCIHDASVLLSRDPCTGIGIATPARRFGMPNKFKYF